MPQRSGEARSLGHPCPPARPGGAGAEPLRQRKAPGPPLRQFDRAVGRSDETSRPKVFTFEEVATRNTGRETPLPAWLERQKRSESLGAQTRVIAERLESQGIPAYVRRPELSIVGHVTGGIDDAETYRPLYILPVVAQRERHGMLQAFDLFREEHPQRRFFRYAVVTFGSRVPLHGQLREAIQRLQRRISKWSSAASARYGLRVLLRATEFTIDAALTFHVHCNVIYFPGERLSKATWSECLSWSGKFFGAHWHDSGRLRDPREIIKYVTKPADVARLDGPELAWLYGQTRDCKIVQPMGEFSAFRRELERSGQRVVFVQASEGSRLARMRRHRRSPAKVTQASGPTENMPLARILPMAKFMNRAEPFTIFRNFTTKPVTEGGRHRLRAFEQQCAEADGLWHESEARQLRRDAPEGPDDTPL